MVSNIMSLHLWMTILADFECIFVDCGLGYLWVVCDYGANELKVIHLLKDAMC